MSQDHDSSTEDKIQIGAKVDKKVNCSNCNKEGITSNFFSYQGKDGKEFYVCKSCKDKINAELDEETKNQKMIRAIFLGILSAVIGGILWYYISIGTGYQIGYMGIGLGYLVGLAVVWGSGKKRGIKLQVASSVITLVTLYLAEYFILFHYIEQYALEEGMLGPDEYINLPLFSSDVLTSIISPIGLLIWAIAIYVAFRVPQPRKI